LQCFVRSGQPAPVWGQSFRRITRVTKLSTPETAYSSNISNVVLVSQVSSVRRKFPLRLSVIDNFSSRGSNPARRKTKNICLVAQQHVQDSKGHKTCPSLQYVAASNRACYSDMSAFGTLCPGRMRAAAFVRLAGSHYPGTPVRRFIGIVHSTVSSTVFYLILEFLTGSHHSLTVFPRLPSTGFELA